jgi:hypothetical protein
MHYRRPIAAHPKEDRMDKLRSAIVGGALALTAASTGAQSIPPGQMPPAGLCRVWIDGVPPGRQPRATDCATARRNAPANSRIIYGGDANLRTNTNGQYDPRRDPRSPQYDPRYGTYDPRNGTNNGTYDPRNGTNNGTYDPRHTGTYDPRYPNSGTVNNGGVYDPRRTTNSNGTYDSRMSRKDREKWEKKREKEYEKAQKKGRKGHDRDDDHDDDRDR